MAWWLSSAQCTLYFFEVKYVHERQQGGGETDISPPGNWDEEAKILINLKSAA